MDVYNAEDNNNYLRLTIHGFFFLPFLRRGQQKKSVKAGGKEFSLERLLEGVVTGLSFSRWMDGRGQKKLNRSVSDNY